MKKGKFLVEYLQGLASIVTLLISVYCLAAMLASSKTRKIEFFLIGYQNVLDVVITGVCGVLHNSVLFVYESGEICRWRNVIVLVQIEHLQLTVSYSFCLQEPHGKSFLRQRPRPHQLHAAQPSCRVDVLRQTEPLDARIKVELTSLAVN